LLSKRLKKHYDDYYEEESEWRRICAIDKVENIRGFCERLPHRRILEIGSGEGAILHRLDELSFGEELYSLEISKAGVDIISRRKIPILKECRLFNGADIPYENDYFDLAILSHVVEHLEHPRQILYEAGRVARYVFVEVPLEDNVRLKKDYQPDSVGHINFFSPKTIRRILQTCDFEILAQTIKNPSYPIYRYQYGSGAWLRYLPKEISLRLFPPIAPSFWTYHCSLVCQSVMLHTECEFSLV
jgi:SAM-dependent methyltransferase